MIKTVLFLQSIEILAFLTGIYFYLKNRDVKTLNLVRFLGFIVLIEILGWYTSFIDDNGFLSFLKGTLIQENYWLYNIQLLISMLFYITYFKWNLKSKKAIKILNVLSFLFLIGSGLFLIFSDVFFVSFSSVTVIVGTLLIFLSIAFYYLELLKSNQILNVHRTLPFYISVGTLIFHLCTTPLFIYSVYYSTSLDPEFVNLYRVIIFSSNFILYSIYIIGFLVCFKSKNHY